MALPPSFFILHQNKKKWNCYLKHFQQLLFRTFSHPMNFIFLVLVLILKTKIGRRTQKSAANDANILVGCISNPKNIYFEVCMVIFTSCQFWQNRFFKEKVWILIKRRIAEVGRKE